MQSNTRRCPPPPLVVSVPKIQDGSRGTMSTARNFFRTVDPLNPSTELYGRFIVYRRCANTGPLRCPFRTSPRSASKANVIISFNNFPAKDSVPFLNELRDLGLSMGDMGSIGDNLSGIARA